VRYAEGTLPTDFGFTGQRNVPDVNLIHMGARWYDPRLGRWISADSIVPDFSNPQSLNRYSYAGNNTVRYRDPTGYYKCENVDCSPICGKSSQWIWAHGYPKSQLKDLFAQNQQPDYLLSCGPFAMAMGINLLTGGNISGRDMSQLMEWMGYKLPPKITIPLIDKSIEGGMGPQAETSALDHLFYLANPDHPPFTAEFFEGGTRSMVINNINKGNTVIVGVSWKAGGLLGMPPLFAVTGHSLVVVVGYDSKTGELAFLDSVDGVVRTESQFETRYGVSFEQAWQQQPNWDFPAGGMVIISPNP
jgi:RHS repeat-associated protein